MRLWRNRAFVVFWSARTISFAGTGITMVVLPVLVYSMTRSPAWVAMVGLMEFVPYLAFGLLAGAVADRVNRKRIMVACDVTAAVLLVTVPVTAAFHRLVIAQPDRAPRRDRRAVDHERTGGREHRSRALDPHRERAARRVAA